MVITTPKIALSSNRIKVIGQPPDGSNHAKTFKDNAECAEYAKSRGWGVLDTTRGEDHTCPDCLRVEQARLEGKREQSRQAGAYVDAALVMVCTS